MSSSINGSFLMNKLDQTDLPDIFSIKIKNDKIKNNGIPKIRGKK